ncbi:hypothetical protein, partial [Streptomyces sp. NPDC096153]|uniref:hypothetical protein n=1 Tax=Streptomyces sp. NPDC096153 TaxID=3155548 RepID=UPI0033329A57
MKAVTPAVALTIATTAAVALGSTGTAHALQRTCAVNGAHWWLPDTCHTYGVDAKPSGHCVDIGIRPYRGCKSSWKVRDIANVVVRAGQAGNHNERYPRPLRLLQARSHQGGHRLRRRRQHRQHLTAPRDDDRGGVRTRNGA